MEQTTCVWQPCIWASATGTSKPCKIATVTTIKTTVFVMALLLVLEQWLGDLVRRLANRHCTFVSVVGPLTQSPLRSLRQTEGRTNIYPAMENNEAAELNLQSFSSERVLCMNGGHHNCRVL